MIKINDCAFNSVLGDIDLVPVLGSRFTNFFPSLIIIFFMFNFFDLYGLILSKLGLKAY